MSLLGKKPLICHLTSSYIEILDRKKNILNRLTFSTDHVRFSEVINKDKFKDEILKFINELKFKKNEAIILLSAELVYSSKINLSNKIEKEEVDKFLVSLPIARNNTYTILHKNKNKNTLQILTTNKQIYEIIVNALSVYNIEAISVSPISIFLSKTSDKDFTVQKAKSIKGLKGSLKMYNFLQKDHDSYEEEEIEQEEKSEKEKEDKDANKNIGKQIVFFIISLLVLIGMIAYALISTETVPSPWAKEEISPTPPIPTATQSAITPTLTSQPSPTIEPLVDKSEIKIQVLNGSDIAGQAGKVSELLQNSEFENITVGNIASFNERTTITYGTLLSEDLLAEITNAIEVDLPDPTIKKATQASEFDVQIIIGSF